MAPRLRLALTLVLALVVLLAAGALGARWALGRWMQSAGPAARDTVVVLPRGVGLSGIAARLGEAGVVDRPWMLQLAARLHDRDRRLQAGEYAFPPGATPEQVLAKLESGEVVLHPVTLAEGLTVAEMFAVLAASEVLEGELPAAPPEGTLLPETFLVPRGQPRARLVEQMRAEMQGALARAWEGRAPGLPLETPEQMLALASIIEKETALAAEYPLVAAVFLNRLRKGMPLQTDPTVIYALTGGKGPLGRPLTRADLDTADPYNTYKNQGLPPGPIANPGRSALEAAGRPAEVDYLYFVADGSGGHAFARTLAEHNRNVAKWRRSRNGG
ncbi:MAG TPA: endolytic transglycosylase MltG [Geminicoccaceae bacterium]|nr:endolytic transglycosylase MltG [Geminicoccus sp.]HMU51485.1 endolytic transglycosylase MltG [Geminicoccaceae bacterium]